MKCNICKKTELEIKEVKDGRLFYNCPNCSNEFVVNKDYFKEDKKE